MENKTWYYNIYNESGRGGVVPQDRLGELRCSKRDESSKTVFSNTVASLDNTVDGVFR